MEQIRMKEEFAQTIIPKNLTLKDKDPVERWIRGDQRFKRGATPSQDSS